MKSKKIFENKEVKNSCVNSFNSKVIYDQTDHFSFVCNKCDSALEIAYINNYNWVMYFHLHCSKCNLSSTRKLYLAKETNDLISKQILNFNPQFKKSGKD